MRIALDGTAFAVSDKGQGAPALVFLHYFGGTGRSWSEVIALLDDSFRCVAPDLRGFGATDSTPTGYAIEQQADDVAALIQALELPHFVLVGHSMGGKIALALAARRPVGLRALVLLAPSPPTPEPMTEQDRAELLRGYGNEAAARQTVMKVTAHALPTAVFEREVENHVRASEPAWRAWLEHGSREDISASVELISVPTLVLSGSADQTIPSQVLQREVIDRIVGARLAMIKDVGHLSPLEAPESIAEQIRALAAPLA